MVKIDLSVLRALYADTVAMDVDVDAAMDVDAAEMAAEMAAVQEEEAAVD